MYMVILETLQPQQNKRVIYNLFHEILHLRKWWKLIKSSSSIADIFAIRMELRNTAITDITEPVGSK